MTILYLPKPQDAIRTAYNHLVAEMDQRIQNLVSQRFRSLLYCRPGCSDCCVEIAVLPLEAAILRDALLQKKGQALEQFSRKGCVFLDQNSYCRLYAYRPILCRTQGIPLAYVDPASETIEVSACPLNFGEGVHFEPDDLFFMDAVNDRLARLNILYCHLNNLQPDLRVALSDLLNHLDE
jgi:uncharacterized protein